MRWWLIVFLVVVALGAVGSGYAAAGCPIPPCMNAVVPDDR